jgi:hypothetical protein
LYLNAGCGLWYLGQRPSRQAPLAEGRRGYAAVTEVTPLGFSLAPSQHCKHSMPPSGIGPLSALKLTMCMLD